MTGRPGGAVLVVGPHPPQPSAAARLCARLGAQHVRAGAEVLTVDRLPSAAHRAVTLRGVAGAAAVAWLARGADRLELVLEPALLQRPGALSPEHRAVAAAWAVALRVPATVRVHVLDPVDLRQLGLHFGAADLPGVEVVQHVPEVDRSTPPAAGGSPTGGSAAVAEPTSWERFAAAVAERAAADRLAGLRLRLPAPLPPPPVGDADEVDRLSGDRPGPGAVIERVAAGVTRLGRAARMASSSGRHPRR